VGNLKGSVEFEPLVARHPDLIVSWIWDKDNPASSQGAIPEELTEQVAGIAPVVFLTQGDSNDVEPCRIEAFVEAMGADLLPERCDPYRPVRYLDDPGRPAVRGDGQSTSGGQGWAGAWLRDLPLNYRGLTTFLESVLEPLRNAEKVS
jgi:hypothetical protein